MQPMTDDIKKSLACGRFFSRDLYPEDRKMILRELENQAYHNNLESLYTLVAICQLVKTMLNFTLSNPALLSSMQKIIKEFLSEEVKDSLSRSGELLLRKNENGLTKCLYDFSGSDAWILSKFLRRGVCFFDNKKPDLEPIMARQKSLFSSLSI